MSSAEMSHSSSLPVVVHSGNNKLSTTNEGSVQASNECLPNELLIALFQNPPNKEEKRSHTRLPSLNVSTAVSRKAPASVWTYPNQRQKLSHLTKNTPCVCGAGRDISFLYDVPTRKKDLEPIQMDVFDASRPRAKEIKPITRKSLELSDSLIPEEYHVVKNKGVLGLECHDDPFATQPEDHEKHLVVFPSMNPASRYEVIQLKKVLDDMLEKAGVNDPTDPSISPTQMHQLLELIKKEQNIYNIIFHELIRQVSIECLERGELLASLRQRYADLLNRVPQQIKSLHDEVLAQRALDRRLTEELVSFQSTVSLLTSELNAVKEHDRKVVQDSLKVQQDLKTALADASKNSNMLVEYRDLYELQRQRLEKQVDLIADELQTWCETSYCLAGKIIEEHCLNSTRQLCVAEKSWSRLASHFAIALCDRDMTELTSLQSSVDGWHMVLDELCLEVRAREDDIKHQLKLVLDDLKQWTSTSSNADGRSEVGIVPADKINILATELKAWQQILSYVSDKFGGESVLASQEVLTSLKRYVSGWTNSALRVFLRHDSDNNNKHPSHSHMIQINHEVECLLKQYTSRITGENGVIDNIQTVENGLESWNSRLTSTSISEQQRTQLYEQIESWVGALSESIANIGSMTRQKEHDVCSASDVVHHVYKWLQSTQHSIDSEDAKLTEQVSVLHRQMIQWITTAMISLAPCSHKQSKEARNIELTKTKSIAQLQADIKALSTVLTDFTKLLTRRCSQFIALERQRRLDRADDDADHEHLELLRLTEECDQWVKLTSVVLTELNLIPPLSTSSRRQNTTIQTDSETDASVLAIPAVELPQTEASVEAAESTRLTDRSRPATTLEMEQTSNDVIVSGQSDMAAPGTSATAASDVEMKQELLSTEHSSLTGDHADVDREPSDLATGENAEREQLEVIGYDASTRTVDLPQPLLTNDPTQPGYAAFMSVQYLQQQLLLAETRAQQAEEKVLATETALVEALDKLRLYERSAGGGGGGRTAITTTTLSADTTAAATSTASSLATTAASATTHRTTSHLSTASSQISTSSAGTGAATSSRDKSFHRAGSKIKSKKK